MKIASIARTGEFIAASRQVAFEADALLDALDPDTGSKSIPEAIERLQKALNHWADLDYERYPHDYIELDLDGNGGITPMPGAA